MEEETNEEDNKFIEDDINFEVDKIELSKKKCIKNLIVLSFSIFFLFSAYGSLNTLQSSLNSEASLGTISLFVIFSSFFLSCLISIPSLVTTKFGYKWSLFMSEICYTIYIIANLYPKVLFSIIYLFI
jgi:hypothetical protein